MQPRYPQDKLTIVGGGIVGALEAYFAYLNAQKDRKQIRVTIHEKNKAIADTTTSHLVPSLTPDEIFALPLGQELIRKMQLPFSKPGGIRVDDVEGVNGTAADQFIARVLEYSRDEEGHQVRRRALLELGKMSMNLWQRIYDDGDSDLKRILEESNFNPCREPSKNNSELHDGYRIDLIYNVDDAKAVAHSMKADYDGLGYANCTILSPEETMARDPFLTDFCVEHSVLDHSGTRHWKDEAVALWRPGGCIDTKTFLPKFYAYLKKVMGQYTNESGKNKDCFQIKLDRNIIGVNYRPESKKTVINGLRFFGTEQTEKVKQQKQNYDYSDYVFCPGEAVGTLSKLGFHEPVYSGFAGASLMLNIPISGEMLERYAQLNHCMEVHQEGISLAWQARFKQDTIFIGIAGGKAFYSDQKPHKDQDFAKDRNLFQLNTINEIFPDCISLALHRDTKGQKLEMSDLVQLECSEIAERWVGTRALAYDGFPTLGALYHEDHEVSNARTTTHLGSGGGSFSPASIFASRSAVNKQAEPDKLIQDVLSFSRSNR